MAQLSYGFLMEVASAGLLADCGFKNCLSPRAYEDIPIGRGVAKVVGEDMTVRLPNQNLSTIVFDADLVTSNEIDGDINGVAIATVTFAVSHLNTMNLIAAAIEALDANLTATVGGANNRTITIVGNADSETIAAANWVVTLGASQAGVTETNTTSDTLYGVALRIQNKTNLLDANGSAGPAPYYEGEAVSMLTKGRVYVYVENAVDSDDPVYLRYVQGGDADELVGQFRSDADGGDAFLVENARWIWGASADGLAVLEINMP